MAELSEMRKEVQDAVAAIKAIKNLTPFETFYLRTLLKPSGGASEHSIKKDRSAPAKKATRRATKRVTTESADQ